MIAVKQKWAKPEGFKGRTIGTTTYKKYKWSVVMYDKETEQLKSGKFSTVKELNEEWGLKLSGDHIWRLMTHSRVDENKRNGPNSFLARYGHIKIEKIDEPRNY
jgi:hypothetical protein